MALTKKKQCVLLIAVIILVSVLPCTAYASGSEVSVAVQAVGVKGEYRAITYIVNNPGISVYNITLEYDNNAITPVSISLGDALVGMVFASNLEQASNDESKKQLNRVTAVWGAPEDKQGDGILFTVIFRAVATTIPDELPQITLVVNKIIGSESDLTAAFRSTGSITDTNNPQPNESLAGDFVGKPYVDEGLGSVSELPDAGNSDGMDKSRGFGRVPQTGTPDIVVPMVAMSVLILISSVLWKYILLRIKELRTNDGQ